MALFKRKKKEENVEVHPHHPPVAPERAEEVKLPEKPQEKVARPEIESETEIFKKFWHWMWQAKGTMTLILLTVSITFITWLIFGIGGDMLWEVGGHGPAYLLKGNIVRYITAMFFHANEAHLFGNMLWLLVFGRIVERKFGTGKMVALYFAAGILAGVIGDAMRLYFGGAALSIGASGAVMGLVAAALLLQPFQISFIFGGIPLPLIFVGWLSIFSDIFGAMSGGTVVGGLSVGHFTHIGGYIGMLFLLFLLIREDRKLLRRNLLINLGFAGAFFLLTIFIGEILVSIVGVLCLIFIMYGIMRTKKAQKKIPGTP